MIREMKDSGVEWIGETPENWNVTKFKHVMKKEKILCENYTNENILSLTKSGVIVRDVENPTGKMPATFNGYQYVKQGDLLLCLFDIDVTPRCVGIVKDNGITSPAYSRYHLKKGNSLRYYNYLLTYLDDNKVLLSFTKSLRNTLTDEYFGVVKTLSPSLVEQQKIADFLDEKTNHIDSIIEKTKQSIEEFKKYKHALVTEAVTTGLNPAVKMKDSGIEWIGNIPDSWGIKKIKNIFKIVQGGTPSTSNLLYWDEGSIFWATPKDMNNMVNGELKMTEKKITVEGLNNSSAQIIQEDSIIISSRAPVGKVAINKIPLATNQGCKSLVDTYDKTNINFYYYLFTVAKEALNVISTGTTFVELSSESLKNFTVVVPTIDEQQQIAEYLDEKTTHIDSLIENKVNIISQLEEYKKSMIYEYVTGKKEVR